MHIQPASASAGAITHTVAATPHHTQGSEDSNKALANSSETESEGPATPSVRAQDLQLHVPKLDLKLSQFGAPVCEVDLIPVDGRTSVKFFE